MNKNFTVTCKNNILNVNDDVGVNMANVLTIKKFDKSRNEDNKYTIGVAAIPSTSDMKAWQFIYTTNNPLDRDECFDKIMAVLQG
jgi:hypothetical protein